MEHRNEIITRHLREQLAIEEHLCRLIQEQAANIAEPEFSDAKELLEKTGAVLEKHFNPLNTLLDEMDQKAILNSAKERLSNGDASADPAVSPNKQSEQAISKILRDDYSALNLITISNTLLHTTALALDSAAVAAAALAHLGNLAPLVVKLGKLLPSILLRELRAVSPEIDLSVADTALKNTRTAWQRA